jgi:hypothetical protein
MMNNQEYHPIGHRIPRSTHILAEDIDPNDIVRSMGQSTTIKASLNALDRDISVETLTDNFWETYIVVKAVVDRVATNDKNRIRIIDEATNLMAEHYAGFEYRDRIKRIKKELGHFGINLSRKVEQKHREDTGFASHPNGSMTVANRLKEITKEPILFIPICHSGVPTGVQTLLYHRQAYPESTLYPIRYSIQTGYDLCPIISKYEQSHISNLSENRAVVVIDDVASSGNTISGVIRACDKFLPNDVSLLGIANDDRRQYYNFDNQGKYWDKLTNSRRKIADNIISRTINRTVNNILSKTVNIAVNSYRAHSSNQ